MAIINCEKYAITLKKLKAKLALPSKVLLIYLNNISKLTLINNNQFYFGNFLRVRWQACFVHLKC